MNTKDPVAELAKFLNDEPWSQRERYIQQIKDETKFCWSCGMDYGDDRRVCYCTRDE